MSKKSPDIKIFVSHRIDQDSETIDNPLYIPVRCGAVFDQREGVTMLGDDTGDNISEKRMSFCELTVMYWAWKNMDADYYGFCHYRRYISFSDSSFMTADNHSGLLVEPYLSQSILNKYCLNNEKKMRSVIAQYDMITTPPEDVFFSGDGHHESVLDLCKFRIRDFDMDGVNKLIEIIKSKYPQYAEVTDEYFQGHYAKYYNCFIMRRDLFHEMCSFVFPVLFELEKSLSSENYNQWKTRMPGFMAENLIGIFYLYLKKRNAYQICEKDLIFLQQTDAIQEIKPAFSSKNIPVVFSSSDFFAPYAVVFVQSLLNHISPDWFYDLIILQSSMSSRNKDFLLKIVKPYSNVSLRFFNPTPLLKGAKFYINSANQSEEAYYRILAPYILKHYNRAIVMDCDIIMKADIAELFQIDLHKKVAGIVPDVVWHGFFLGLPSDIKRKKLEDFPIEDPLHYVNTGVILFDLVKYRTKYSMDYVLNFAQSRKFEIQEQDALNLMLEKDIFYLPIEWNVYLMVNEYIKTAIDDFAPAKEKKAYYFARENAKILHWAAQPKPWAQPDIDLSEEFWEVAKTLPIYELILGRMIDTKLGALHPAVFDLQNRMGIFDTRSSIRKRLDKLLPEGSKRRKFAALIVPRDSLRWKLCKQIYYIFKPQYRPAKQ